MVTLRTSSACLLVSLLAGAASAQSEVFASGFLHQATGHAQIGPVEGRRLPVRNLGSSGEDGVEIKVSSAHGGGVVIDAPDLKKKPAAEIKIKIRGWDGMIYGTYSMIGNGDGTGVTVYDYSEAGAIGIAITRYDGLGQVISDEYFPGDVVGKEWVPDDYCEDGSTPIPWGRWVKLCNTCEPVWVEGWMCPGTGQEYSNNNAARTIVRPILPAGTPVPGGMDAAMITARGMSSFAITDTHIGTFGAASWGLGDARPVETCGSSGDCSERALVIENLGTGGADGVAIDVGSDAGQTEVTIGRGGWDLKQSTKFHDDAGTQILAVAYGINPATGQPAMSLDFSGLGIDGYKVEYLDQDGVVLGTDFKNNYDPALGTVLCGPGYRERWVQGADGKWYFAGCDLIAGIIVPGVGEIGPVASMCITPVGADYHRVRTCTVTGTAEGGAMEINSVIVTPACKADFDHTGFVDTEDYDAFIRAFEAGTEDADFDDSGFVDIEDFTGFVHAFEAGC
ncbi:MAG: hypothetical protein GIKADHBN_03170 [Phycisphaerales bacterium]|nr:hypothetical protein [Phycisphaerales bacterium]